MWRLPKVQPSLIYFVLSCFVLKRPWALLLNMITPCRKRIVRALGDGKIKSLPEYWEQRDGEHSFLEDVQGEQALKWVKQRNADSLNTFGDPTTMPMYNKVLSILDSKDKIPHVSKIDDQLYNFWQDDKNPRGVYRRTTIEKYKNPQLAASDWEVVLDFDALGKIEGESWVFKGITLCDKDSSTRVLMSLSRGGSDATVIREFDLVSKSFIPESDGGFVLPEAKSRVSWLSESELLLGTDFKDRKSMTNSGYPRVVRHWKRGTSLSDAPVVFEGSVDDVSVSSYVVKHCGHEFEIRCRSLTFYTSKYWLRESDSATWHELTALQEDASISQFLDQLLIDLRSDWLFRGKSYHAGSLLAVDAMQFATGCATMTVQVLFEPTDRISLDSYTPLKSFLALHVLDNVKSAMRFWSYSQSTGWKFEYAEARAVVRGASVRAFDKDQSNQCWLTTSSFLQPSQLALVDAENGVSGIALATKSPLKSLPPQFDATGLEEVQAEAVSADGTQVPYFMIRRKGMRCDGSSSTLLYGYGGFEISMLPSYASVTGATWLENKNRVYVIANIRGGGEFGPRWHQAALKQNRSKCYDDFIAVAEHLVSTGVTSQRRLAIRGGSNGGLLMGNMIVRRPDLFGAVVCEVPLLDMKRYSQLLAGASWVAEYGDPAKEEEWAFLRHYSAYHNIDHERAATQYPPLLMATSTKDDRVHPYHARAFVKRLQEVGHSSVHYYENMEGGHAGAADAKQQSFKTCLVVSFLEKTICS